MGNLGFLNDWAEKASGYLAKHSAQGYLSGAQGVSAIAGSACGSGDDDKENELQTDKDGKEKKTPAEEDIKKRSEPKPTACGAGGR